MSKYRARPCRENCRRKMSRVPRTFDPDTQPHKASGAGQNAIEESEERTAKDLTLTALWNRIQELWPPLDQYE